MEISPRMVIDWLNSDGTSWSQKLFLAIGVTEGLLKKAPLRGLDTKLMLPMDGSPRHVAARITSNPENIAAAEMRFHHSASSDGTAH